MPADPPEVLVHLGQRVEISPFAVRQAVLAAERLDDGLPAAQPWCRDEREQVVLDLSVEADEEHVVEPRATGEPWWLDEVARAAHLLGREIDDLVALDRL